MLLWFKASTKTPISTVKYGDASFWDCFAPSGPQAFVKINGIINFVNYLDISG